MGWEQRYKLIAAALREGKTVKELIASRRAEGKSYATIGKEFNVYPNAVRFWDKKDAEKVVTTAGK